MVLLTRNTDMEDTMPQTVPSAGFTPPCDYSNFAENFDLSLLPGGDQPLAPPTQFYTHSPAHSVAGEKEVHPKIYATYYPDSPNQTSSDTDLEFAPDFQKLLVPEENKTHSPISNIYLEVPSAKSYTSSPVGALSPYSPQGLLSPNDQFNNYRQSVELNFYPSSPELSLYTPSPNSVYSRSPGEDFLQSQYIKEETNFSTSPLPQLPSFRIKEEHFLSPCSFSSPTSPSTTYSNLSSPERYNNQKAENSEVLELFENTTLEKQIKQESTVDFGSILQSFPSTESLRKLLENNFDEKTRPQTVPEKPKDHQLLREVLRDTSFQKKYNIKPFDFGFLEGEIKMEEPDDATPSDLMSCNEQIARENIEPVLNLAIEQMRKDVDNTCTLLKISPDPSQWDSTNVLSWLRWTSQQFGFPEPVAEQWNIPGSALIALTEEDFTRRAPQGGMTLHAQLEIWKAAYSDVDLGMQWFSETTSSNASSGDVSEGNLELLSPEERRHYKKRKEYSQIDMDERNAYNVIQDLYSRDSEDIMNSKKSKSRKKRHIDSEIGMGDSREMMIPKEKKKSKKKKRENSPVNCSNAKRKHRRKDEDYEPRNDITVALEELQDDVFESNNDEFVSKPEKMKKSPRRSDKLYVQRKNKFEPTTRAPGTTNHRSNPNFEESRKGLTSYMPLQIAIPFQGWWMRFSTLCHGLLSGLSLGHVLYIFCNNSTQDIEFLVHYAYYSDIYVGLFYALCVICIISVFDRVDIAHLDCAHFRDLFIFRKSSMAVIIYIACLLVHLSAARTDDKLSLVTYNNTTAYNISRNELSTWNHLSLWRAILSFLAWLLVGLGLPDDMLYLHLKNMEKYLPDK